MKADQNTISIENLSNNVKQKIFALINEDKKRIKNAEPNPSYAEVLEYLWSWTCLSNVGVPFTYYNIDKGVRDAMKHIMKKRKFTNYNVVTIKRLQGLIDDYKQYYVNHREKFDIVSHPLGQPIGFTQEKIYECEKNMIDFHKKYFFINRYDVNYNKLMYEK